MKKLIVLYMGMILLGCQPDEIGPQRVNPINEPVLKGRQIYLINEGNFGRGNASISAYQPGAKNIQHQVYRSYNDDQPLGDVAQDFARHRDRFYCVLNNSGKIVVMDTTSWQQQGVISGLATPRYFSFYKNHAFVTDLYLKKLWVVNLDLLAVEKEINLPTVGYHTRQWQQKIWVGAGSSLLVIDPMALQVDTTYQLHSGVERLVVTGNHLWALCTGGNAQAQIYQVNTQGELRKKWAFTSGQNPRLLAASQYGEQVYFAMNNAIYSQAVAVTALNPQKLLDFGGQTMYGFQVDATTGELYVADALDYDQPADIYRFSPSGRLLHHFKGGILCSGFWIEE